MIVAFVLTANLTVLITCCYLRTAMISRKFYTDAYQEVSTLSFFDVFLFSGLKLYVFDFVAVTQQEVFQKITVFVKHRCCSVLRFFP